MSDDHLDEIFGVNTVSWIYRKEWDAYTVNDPIAKRAFAPVRPDEGFYYINAMEPLISTMETEIVSSVSCLELAYDALDLTSSDSGTLSACWC